MTEARLILGRKNVTPLTTYCNELIQPYKNALGRLDNEKMTGAFPWLRVLLLYSS